jgi:hypothetical protein
LKEIINMALYLYNLGISLQPPYPSQSRFTLGGTGLMQSGYWLTWQHSNLPAWLQDQNIVFLGQPLNASDWGNPVSDAGAFPAVTGDYIVVRVFLADTPAPSNCLVRLNVVFGHGATAPSTANPLQTPLQLPGGLPRAVVDTDNSTPTQQPTTDSAWAYSMGKIYGNGNDYSFNVGVTLTQGANWYTFGHDPQVHVTVPPEAVVAA